MKKKIIILLIVLTALSGCSKTKNDTEIELKNEIRELQEQNMELLIENEELEAESIANRNEIESLNSRLIEASGQLLLYSGENGVKESNPFLMEEIEYLIGMLKEYPDIFPIRDANIELEYSKQYAYILEWFEELSGQNIQSAKQNGNECIFELIKIEKILDPGTLQYDTPPENAEYFKVYYLILEKDENDELKNIGSLDLLHDGSVIEVQYFDEQWCITPT